MNKAGRPMGKKDYTPKDVYQMVCAYVEEGSYLAAQRKIGINRRTIGDQVKKFIKNNPDEYNKILDAFLARNKQEMIFQNAHTTQKALYKVDELLEDTTSLKEAAMAYGILYDKGALMKGESTQNSAIVIKMSGNIEELSQ